MSILEAMPIISTQYRLALSTSFWCFLHERGDVPQLMARSLITVHVAFEFYRFETLRKYSIRLPPTGDSVSTCE